MATTPARLPPKDEFLQKLNGLAIPPLGSSDQPGTPSFNFHAQLDKILHDQEFEKCRANLEEKDLAWLVDYLDEALGSLDPSSGASRKCLRELRSICAQNATLPTPYVCKFDGLKVGEIPLFSGGFGDVYKEKFGGLTVCVKRVRVSAQNGKKAVLGIFCHEAVMWKYLRHENILSLLGVTISPPQLISRWIPGGDLSEYVKNNPDANRIRLLLDTAKGLDYLHSRNVIHGDLKGFNIYVDTDIVPPRALIADFGVAIVTKNLESIRPSTRQDMISPRWSAPEVLSGGNPSTESDVYSFAMVTIEVFTGQLPFGTAKTDYTAVFLILNDKRPSRPPHPDCTDKLWALTERCWSKEAKSRPAVSEILKTLDPSSVP